MKSQPAADHGMRFERTLMLFFGEKGYQTAGQSATPKSRREWLRRILKLLMKTVDKIETTVRHKKLLMANVERAQGAIKTIEAPTWELVDDLLCVIGRLLGFDLQHGSRLHTLSYWQTYSQYHNSVTQSGGDGMQSYYDEFDAVSLRQAVVQSLRKDGLNDFKIALVLNTTENEVQQLRLGTHRKLRKRE